MAAAIPPILAEICQKGRKTKDFRSSRATDNVVLRVLSIYHR